MKRYFILTGILSVLAVGCKQKEAKVSNAATEYTGALQQDVQKAQAAADKANQAIANENAATNQSQEQTK